MLLLTQKISDMKTKIVLTKECENCGITFEKLASTSRRVWQLQRFCSIKCPNILITKVQSLPAYIQLCGLGEPAIMEVDHIKPKSQFPELAKDIENLVTLCPNDHHRKTNKEAREYGQNAYQQVTDIVAKGF